METSNNKKNESNRSGSHSSASRKKSMEVLV